jgi:hypothetical protein
MALDKDKKKKVKELDRLASNPASTISDVTVVAKEKSGGTFWKILIGILIAIAAVGFIGWGVTCQKKQAKPAIIETVNRWPPHEVGDITYHYVDEKEPRQPAKIKPTAIHDSIDVSEELKGRSRIGFVRLGIGSVSVSYLDSLGNYDVIDYPFPRLDYGFLANLDEYGRPALYQYDFTYPSQEELLKWWRVEIDLGANLSQHPDTTMLIIRPQAAVRFILTPRRPHKFNVGFIPSEIRWSVHGIEYSAGVRFWF